MDVLIAGGGPTGLMLAGELALAGVETTILERRANQDLAGLRAGGLNARTLELLDQRGIVGRFLAEGRKMQRAPFGGATYDISDLPTRHNYFLALWQTDTERTLAAWVRELGVPLERGCEVIGWQQDDTGIEVALADGRTRRAKYLVGCDGGRSVVRKQAGIAFPGWDASTSYLIAEVTVAEEPPLGIRRSAQGINATAKVTDQGVERVRVVLCEPQLGARGKPSLEDVRTALQGIYGTDFGLREASYVSRFTDTARQAAAYRQGRVLLAGDAAHVHSPVGGQGLNVGVQDAVNLGWKLAKVVKGESPDALLDSYHGERHPVGARLLRNTMALTALERGDERHDALRGMLGEMMSGEGLRARYFAMMSGLDVHYDLPGTHPVVGRRMPDLDLTTAEGPTRVFPLLRDARPLLLNLSKHGGFDETGVRTVRAQGPAEWELPALGKVAAPAAVLVRPDGYVAWAGEEPGPELAEALAGCGLTAGGRVHGTGSRA